MSDERAVEFGQFSQPGPMQPQLELVGFYEPTQIADLNRHGRLLVVADGVGGAAAGAAAGRYAVQKILHDFYHSREPDLEKRLVEVIRQTNKAIFERNNRYPERRPAATTLLAALIYQNKLLVASVGDGRAYVVWDQDIEHLTGDNSSPQRLAREAEAGSAPAPKDSLPADTATGDGEAGSPDLSDGDGFSTTSAAAAKSRLLAEKESPTPGVTALTLASPSTGPGQALSLAWPLPLPCPLGLSQEVKIDLFTRRLFAGDMLVLCSGGLNGYVTDTEIAQTVSQNPADPASRLLIELAAKRGCQDTVSVSVARVLAKPLTQAAPVRQTLPLAPDWDTLTKAKTNTRPLPVVAVQSASLGRAQIRRRWPIYSAAVVAVLLFSLFGFVAGRYLLASDDAAGGVETAETGAALPATTEVMLAGNSPVTSPPATPQPESSVQVQPTSTTAVTLVAEPASPAARPTEATSVQTGDVIAATPTRPQPTPLPTITLPAGCTNKARFAGDVTVRDGTEFGPGETFEKAWSVTNYGTCPWGGGYVVRFTGGDLMGAAERVPLTSVVEPEATGVISIPMVAPDLPGTYRGNWQMIGLDGEPFGPDLYLEIEVVPGILRVDEANATTLYDFVANATQAQWAAGNVTYSVVETPIDRNLVIPDPQGLVAVGPAELRGDTASPGNVLLTHPHLELGVIEGTYPVDTPLQPGDAIIGSLGLPRAAAINDDGVTFELVFRPTGGTDQLLFSKSVKYEDTPAVVRQALTTIQPGQTGAFILRVKGGNSLSYDWATWIELQLVRP
jgi:serine/threonine protein phosphatase PrpC